MRLHDRRTALAALVLLAAYLGLVIGGALWLGGALGLYTLDPLPSFLQGLLLFNALFLCWRLAVRMAFVWRAYGPFEALRSVPRIVIGNIIGMMAARRAFMLYLRHLRGQRLVWDKTAHRFPDEHSPEAA